MTLVEFIASELNRLHGSLDAVVKDLTPEQWHAVPGGAGKANTVAFEMWHYARTEDNIVRFILQGRRPAVWMEGGWAEKFGLRDVPQTHRRHELVARVFRAGVFIDRDL